MKKPILAILFSSLFMMILVAPSLALIDSSFEVIVMIDINEEEQKEGKEGKEGKESKIDVEWKVWQPANNQSQLAIWQKKESSDFYSNSYNFKAASSIFTPPEQRF